MAKSYKIAVLSNTLSKKETQWLNPITPPKAPSKPDRKELLRCQTDSIKSIYLCILQATNKYQRVEYMAFAKVKLQKWGNSQGIQLSKDLLEQIGLTDLKDISFDVQVNGSEITLRPIVKLSPFEQLFADYDESQPRIQFYWNDEPVGKEIW